VSNKKATYLSVNMTEIKKIKCLRQAPALTHNADIHLSASRLSNDLLQPTTTSAVSLGGFGSLVVEADDDDDDADFVSFDVGGDESP